MTKIFLVDVDRPDEPLLVEVDEIRRDELILSVPNTFFTFNIRRVASTSLFQGSLGGGILFSIEAHKNGGMAALTKGSLEHRFAERLQLSRGMIANKFLDSRPRPHETRNCGLASQPCANLDEFLLEGRQRARRNERSAQNLFESVA
jgi:hypothetical protein